MSTIDDSNGLCTQITVVKLDPGNQQEVLNLMRRRGRFIPSKPGFVSGIVHRSKEGRPANGARVANSNSKIRAGNGVATSLIPAGPALSERP